MCRFFSRSVNSLPSPGKGVVLGLWTLVMSAASGGQGLQAVSMYSDHWPTCDTTSGLPSCSRQLPITRGYHCIPIKVQSPAAGRRPRGPAQDVCSSNRGPGFYLVMAGWHQARQDFRFPPFAGSGAGHGGVRHLIPISRWCPASSPPALPPPPPPCSPPPPQLDNPEVTHNSSASPSKL